MLFLTALAAIAVSGCKPDETGAAESVRGAVVSGEVESGSNEGEGGSGGEADPGSGGAEGGSGGEMAPDMGTDHETDLGPDEADMGSEDDPDADPVEPDAGSEDPADAGMDEVDEGMDDPDAAEEPVPDATPDAGAVDAGVEPMPAPEINGLEIDCDGPPVPGFCVAGEFPYPVNFTVTDANNCSASAQMMEREEGPAGSNSAVNLDGNSASFTHITSIVAGPTIRLTVDCDGEGGRDSEFTEFVIH